MSAQLAIGSEVMVPVGVTVARSVRVTVTVDGRGATGTVTVSPADNPLASHDERSIAGVREPVLRRIGLLSPPSVTAAAGTRGYVAIVTYIYIHES